MITDTDAEDAVEYLENSAIEAAQARADRIYCEQFRNTVKAQLMTEFDDGSTTAVIQERKAYADPRYMQQLDAIQEAVFRDEKCRFMRDAMMARLEGVADVQQQPTGSKTVNGERLTITIAEAAARLGIGRNQAYEAARSGQMPTIKIGNRWLVPTASFEKMLNALPVAKPVEMKILKERKVNVTLRMREQLYLKLKTSANEKQKTLQADIIDRLENSFSDANT